MSCERNREAYFALAAGPGSPAAQAFGSSEAGATALGELFAVGRNAAATPATQALAEAHTRALFAQIRNAGLTPPAHSASGLPRPDAQQGYALAQQTLTALGRGEALPERAAELLAARMRQRQLAGLALEGMGQARCRSCGQFTSAARGHLCPRTATAAQLQRSLGRQLGVPPGAYPEGALAEVLEAARAGPLELRHSVTGEQVQVSLDGLAGALRVGFVPRAWGAGRRVLTPAGQVVTVPAAAGLPPAPEPGGPVARAAGASGLSLDDPASVLGNETIPVQAWLASADIRQLAAGAWSHPGQIPPAVRLLLRREAPRLAADTTQPPELRTAARALAELTFRGTSPATVAERLRDLAQAALAATGGVRCERCGAWQAQGEGHACAGVAIDPRVAAEQAGQDAVGLGFEAGGQALIGEAVRLGRIAPADAGPVLHLARAWAVLDDQVLTAGKIATAVQLWEQGTGRADRPATSPEAALLQALQEGDLAGAVLRANAGEALTRSEEQRLLGLAGLPDRETLRGHAQAMEALWQERQRVVQALVDAATPERRAEAEAALATNGARGRMLAERVRMLPRRWREVLRAGGELPPARDETEGSGA